MLSSNTGPNVTTGNLNPLMLSDPGGPNLNFQGTGLVDPRYVGNIGTAPGQLAFGLYSAINIPIINATPQVGASNRLAAAQSVCSGKTFTLASTQTTDLSPSIPIIPYGSSIVQSNVVSALHVGFGFATGNMSATKTALSVASGTSRFYYVGQKLIVSGVGASANTPLITTVTAVTSTVVTVADAAGQIGSNVQVGTADPSGICAYPYVICGQGQGPLALLDPNQSIARGWSVTSNVSTDSSNWVITAVGYDMFYQPQTEAVPVTISSTAYGKKTFRAFTSFTATNAVSGGQTSGTLAIGTSDLFGYSIRSDLFEYSTLFWIAALQTAATGWVTADTTSPATTSTGDVRGTIQLGTAGPGTGYTTSPNGSRRLSLFASMPIEIALQATNLSYTGMFGVTPV